MVVVRELAGKTHRFGLSAWGVLIATVGFFVVFFSFALPKFSNHTSTEIGVAHADAPPCSSCSSCESCSSCIGTGGDCAGGGCGCDSGCGCK